MKKIVVVRHGQAQSNVGNFANSNPKNKNPLTQLGVEQVKETRDKLKDYKFDRILCSQLQRAKETAEIINEFHNLEIEFNLGLNENNAGEFEGKSIGLWADFYKEHGLYERIKEGESYQEMVDRLHEFVSSLEKEDFNQILLVSHGDPILAIIGYFRKFNYEETFNYKMPTNGEIVEFILE